MSGLALASILNRTATSHNAIQQERIMASDEEDTETIGDGDFDDYEENEIDEDMLDAIEAGADDASDGDSVSPPSVSLHLISHSLQEGIDDDNDSDDSSDEDEDDDPPTTTVSEVPPPPMPATPAIPVKRATPPPPPLPPPPLVEVPSPHAESSRSPKGM